MGAAAYAGEKDVGPALHGRLGRGRVCRRRRAPPLRLAAPSPYDRQRRGSARLVDIQTGHNLIVCLFLSLRTWFKGNLLASWNIQHRSRTTYDSVPEALWNARPLELGNLWNSRFGFSNRFRPIIDSPDYKSAPFEAWPNPGKILVFPLIANL